MSGSSLDGLDIAYTHFQETGGKWSFDIIHADCYAYPEDWITRLKDATSLRAIDYQLLHTKYGHFTGQLVNRFIDANRLHHKVDLVSSHGHTTFHVPAEKMTAQLGDGAAIAAVTGLPVVSDLRGMDIAFGGQGAPIVPIGEKLLLQQYDLLLNLGGIANISAKTQDDYIAFDVCPANRVMNLLANEEGKQYDENGDIAAHGSTNEILLEQLNNLEYYDLDYPKSLANDFGIDIVYPLIKQQSLSTEIALNTYVEHICHQVKRSINQVQKKSNGQWMNTNGHQLLVTGGGAFNKYLVNRLQEMLVDLQIEVNIPEKNLINYKEAMIMALMGVLRWREENNVLASVTGATRNSVGGAIWMGSEA